MATIDNSRGFCTTLKVKLLHKQSETKIYSEAKRWFGFSCWHNERLNPMAFGSVWLRISIKAISRLDRLYESFYFVKIEQTKLNWMYFGDFNVYKSFTPPFQLEDFYFHILKVIRRGLWSQPPVRDGYFCPICIHDLKHSPSFLLTNLVHYFFSTALLSTVRYISAKYKSVLTNLLSSVQLSIF